LRLPQQEGCELCRLAFATSSAFGNFFSWPISANSVRDLPASIRILELISEDEHDRFRNPTTPPASLAESVNETTLQAAMPKCGPHADVAEIYRVPLEALSDTSKKRIDALLRPSRR
jgi:hypothetical protein